MDYFVQWCIVCERKIDHQGLYCSPQCLRRDFILRPLELLQQKQELDQQQQQDALRIKLQKKRALNGTTAAAAAAAATAFRQEPSPPTSPLLNHHQPEHHHHHHHDFASGCHRQSRRASSSSCTSSTSSSTSSLSSLFSPPSLSPTATASSGTSIAPTTQSSTLDSTLSVAAHAAATVRRLNHPTWPSLQSHADYAYHNFKKPLRWPNPEAEQEQAASSFAAVAAGDSVHGLGITGVPALLPTAAGGPAVVDGGHLTAARSRAPPLCATAVGGICSSSSSINVSSKNTNNNHGLVSPGYVANPTPSVAAAAALSPTEIPFPAFLSRSGRRRL
ncbi:hypothetical protein DFJ73DRAFT_777082 [Zopfochytrium polystomum]|nr:hypothetical protein DFJ73DRAFT_777082 [Zopfochytrium polystomum]